MTTMETLKGGQTVDTLVIGRNCTHLEQKKMLYIGRVLVDGFGENQYAMSGDRPIRLTVGKKTADVFICSADRGTTATLELHNPDPENIPEADPEKVKLETGLLDSITKKGMVKVLLISPDCTAARIVDMRKVGRFLIYSNGTVFKIADDTPPLRYKIGRKTADIYVVSAATLTTANLFLHGDPAVPGQEGILPDRVDPETKGFYAGCMYSLRTSPDMASRVWDSNVLKYGFELTANKRMVAIAFICGMGVCFFGMLLLGMLL